MMKYLLSCFLFFSAIACFSQDVIKTADSLLLNSEYTKVVQLVNQNLPQEKDSLQAIVLGSKKAEAFIHLGKFDEAEALLKELLGKSNEISNALYAHGI